MKEQVQHGREFLELDFEEEAAAAIATPVSSEAFISREMAALFASRRRRRWISSSPVLIPGKPAPETDHQRDGGVDEAGSVIVDLAANRRQLRADPVADTITVTDNGVKIIGYATDLPSRLPTQSSQPVTAPTWSTC